ncbi:MAG: helix-turn-helix transcriptional regulator [Verrucomicrobia bacterium]|nr:helix-turn-helix transcriptional regulator [Verrucomicrobiota bacterium]
MTARKCHSDRTECPIAHALDIIGDRWTLLIVRDLLLNGIHEYKDLLQSVVGISTNILSERIQRLEDAGLLQFIDHPENKSRKLYYLTQGGKKLIDPLVEIARWANDHLESVLLQPEQQKAAILARKI